MIVNIQILRGLAALAVVFYHAGYIIPGTVYSDFLAVPIFFAISGFIMTHITRKSADAFLLHRVIRIVPLYWLMTALYAALVVIVYPLFAKRSDNVVTAASFLSDLFFIPRLDGSGEVIYPVLSVGWTLNLEMWFYLLFAPALLMSRRFAPAIVAGIVGAVWLFGPKLSSPFSFYAHNDVIFFSLGILTYYAARLPIAQLSAGFLAALGGAIALIRFAMTGSPTMSFVAPPLIVLGAVLLERRGISCRYRFAIALGSSSYALYLCHPITIGSFREATRRIAVPDMTEHLPVALLAVAVSAGIAWFIFNWIETPLLSFLRGVVAKHAKRSGDHGSVRGDRMEVAHTDNRLLDNALKTVGDT
jgi:exopolysaccharide production protein ExoZ